MATIGPRQTQRARQVANAARTAMPAARARPATAAISGDPSDPAGASHPALMALVQAMARDAARLELARQKTEAEASDPLNEA